MAMTIFGDECISCGDCAPLCPTGAISDGGLAFRIDRRLCTECEGSHAAPKCVEVCPIDHCIVRLAAAAHGTDHFPLRPEYRAQAIRATTLK